MTTTGFSSQVTVHMPSNAWNTITASVIADTRARSTLLQRSAATSNTPSPSAASTEAATYSPRMYSGIAIATSADAPSTCAMPWGRLRAAIKARPSTSTPSPPASMRCTCSRHALCGTTGRIAVAAWSAASPTAGQLARP